MHPPVRAPSSPDLQAWLFAPGSLTARLRQHGRVEVRVLRQQALPLWAPEIHDLHLPCGHVREVVLLLDGRPAVWARSATSLQSAKGPWRALQGLGTRPLAELLFASRPVARAPLQVHALPRGGPVQAHIRRQWLALPQPHPGLSGPMPGAPEAGVPQWARSSVFWHRGHALRVMEAFSPWVAGLPASGRQA